MMKPSTIPGVYLRLYRPDDLSETVAVWYRSTRQAFHYNAIQMSHTLESDTQYFLSSVVPHCQVWLAEVEGASAGLDERQIAGFMALNGSLVELLFVDVGQQRQGIGSALLAKAKALFPQGLRLYTFVRNLQSRAFYEKHGFKAVRFGVSPPPEKEPDVEYLWTPEG